MSKKNKKENNKEKKLKLPITRIISNNLFILRIIHKAAPGMIFLVIFFAALEAGLSFLTGPYLLRYVINGIGAGKSFSVLFLFAIICISVNILTGALFALFYNYMWNIKFRDINRSVGELVYRHAAAVDVACYENPEYYNKLVKAIEECQNRPRNVIRAIQNIVYMITSFSANIALVIAIDPILIIFLLIPLLCIPIIIKVNKICFKRDIDFQPEYRHKTYSRHSFYLADYAKEMRTIGISTLLIRRFRESSERFIYLVKSNGIKIASLNYLKDICLNAAAPLGATVYSVWKTLGAGTMAYGDCVAIVDSITTISYSIVNSADTLIRFQDNALYIETLREFLDYQPKIKSGNKALPKSGDIVLDNVRFKYDGAPDYTIKGISMHIGKNEKIAIVGHNGAGKTTLVKLLLRLYDVEGSITYGGTDIRDLPLDEYRDSFSAVMQDFHVFALSVAENVLLRPKGDGDDEIVKQAIEKSGLAEKIAGYKNGYDTVMTREFDDAGEVMSGGQQQKLAIAHVYSKDNRFVILDEPSSALDPIAEHDMYEKMNEACKDCGMIFISHRLSSAVSADRIYLMENGQITESGTHTELMAKNGRYAEMFRHQAENYADINV